MLVKVLSHPLHSLIQVSMSTKNWKTLGNFTVCVFITKHSETAKRRGTAHACVLPAHHCCSASQGGCIPSALRDCLGQDLCTGYSSWHRGKVVVADSGKRVSSWLPYSAQGAAGLQLLLIDALPSATPGSLGCAGLTFPSTILFHKKILAFQCIIISWSYRKAEGSIKICTYIGIFI